MARKEINMKYKMMVAISDPENTELNWDWELFASFGKGGFDYGNGYWVSIYSENRRFEKLYDIRYDRSFNPKKAAKWLTDWAHSYWCGKNGAYKVDSLKIEKIED